MATKTGILVRLSNDDLFLFEDSLTQSAGHKLTDPEEVEKWQNKLSDLGSGSGWLELGELQSINNKNNTHNIGQIFLVEFDEEQDTQNIIPIAGSANFP